MAVSSLRATLAALPADWILWAISEDGAVSIHEGPGAARLGVRPDEVVGKRYEDAFRSLPAVRDFLRSTLFGRRSELLAVRGEHFSFSGGPVRGGGSAGLALAMGREEGGAAGAPGLARAVIQIGHPIPEIGAHPGDLLVPNQTDPTRVGLFRSLHLTELPAWVVGELGLDPDRNVRGSRSAPSAAPDSPDATGAARPPHLRVLS